jgi:hypothetical protein
MFCIKRSLILYAIGGLCIVTNVNCSPIMIHNSSSVVRQSKNISDTHSSPIKQLAFQHIKSANNQLNRSETRVNDFIPTLTQLMSNKTKRHTIRERRSLSLKLLTLILQEDPPDSTNATKSISPDAWILPIDVDTPILPDYWTGPNKAVTHPDTATTWSDSLYSVIAKPATWNDEPTVVKTEDNKFPVLLETIIIPSNNLSDTAAAMIHTSLNLRPDDGLEYLVNSLDKIDTSIPNSTADDLFVKWDTA